MNTSWFGKGTTSLMAAAAVAVAPIAAAQKQPESAPTPADSVEETRPEDAARPAIRTFDIATLSALGREIHRHDSLAWIATDVLFAQVKQQQLADEGGRGWVVDTSGETLLVRFVRETDGAIEAAYDIVFAKDEKPRLLVPEDRKLTAAQLAAHKASRSAIDAMIERNVPWCGGNPNFAVLPDPDGSGYLVYILRPKPSAHEIPVGGHYRVTVAADGTTVEQVDRLFASCLTMPRNPSEANGGEIVGLSMSHVVSDTPLETHVFLSLQEKLPFSVITPEGRMWMVANGSIENAN